MPEIRGRLDAGPIAACVWCSEATSNRAVTPGRPDLGEVPLHVWCAGEIIVAYRRLGAGKLLPDGAKKLTAFESRLNELDLYREAKLPVPAQPVVAPINATEAEIRFALAFLDQTVPNWRDQVRESEARMRAREIRVRHEGYPTEDLVVRDAPRQTEGYAVDREARALVEEREDFRPGAHDRARAEIESRNRAFAGEDFRVVDPDTKPE